MACVDRAPQRAVAVLPVDHGPLQQFAGCHQGIELFLGLEEVVHPVLSPGRGARVVAETESQTSG